MKTEINSFTAEEVFIALRKDREFEDSLIVPQQLFNKYFRRRFERRCRKICRTETNENHIFVNVRNRRNDIRTKIK